MKRKILNAFKMAKMSDGLEWEGQQDWQSVTTEAVIRYPLAPREAKALLDVVGELRAHGVRVIEVLNYIYDNELFKIYLEGK